MNRMDGKVALVAGGTGNVGERIAAAFLRAGATVIVPTRAFRVEDQAALRAIQAELGAAPAGAGAG